MGMYAHSHKQVVDGCFRCDLSADEARESARPDDWEQDAWCPTHPDVDAIKAEVEWFADQLSPDNSFQWCPKCHGPAFTIEASEEQSGFEEQERNFWVERLSCGHEIATPRQ